MGEVYALFLRHEPVSVSAFRTWNTRNEAFSRNVQHGNGFVMKKTKTVQFASGIIRIAS